MVFNKSFSTTQVNWSLSAPKGEDFATPMIPAEIKKGYPMHTVAGMKVQSVAYALRLDGCTYADFIGDTFSLARRAVYESLGYTIGP